ncbi:MAG: c-type cytochrome [Rhodospirillales bacterium]
MSLSKKLIGVIGAVVVVAVTLPSAVIAADGAKVFKKCAACHSTEAGKHKVGPSLAGVVGRKAGTAEGFEKRYKGLKDADWSWDEASLMAYLENPSKFTKAKTGKRSSMGLKLKKEDDRKAVIEYLKAH